MFKKQKKGWVRHSIAHIEVDKCTLGQPDLHSESWASQSYTGKQGGGKGKEKKIDVCDPRPPGQLPGPGWPPT